MARHRSEEAKRVAAPGCKLPARLPAGEILTDIRLNKWIIGNPIGWGGFGDIYLASDNISKPVDQNAKFIVKIEPHDNGPLFVETNFYIRAAQKHMINEWCKARYLKTIGIPTYEGSGSHIYKGERYRFLIIPHYGIDVNKLFLSNNRKFSEKVVNNLAIQTLEALEYLHSKGYAHADVKGCNILLERNVHGAGIEKSRAYLVDYGLAYRFRTPNGFHKPFVHDERRAHEGTLEFTSRDAHHGTHSRRGDLETLGYNLIQWLCGKLPWEQKDGGMSLTADPEEIHAVKEKSFSDVEKFVQKCFGYKKPPSSIIDFMKYIASLEFESKPDYAYLRNLFGQKKRAENNIAKYFNENHGQVRIPRRENLRVRKPCKPVNVEARITRNTSLENEPFKWEEVLASHPEKLAKVISQPLLVPPTPPPSPPPVCVNPTYAMLSVMYRNNKEREMGSRHKSNKFLNDIQAKWINPPLETSAQLKEKSERRKLTQQLDAETNNVGKKKRGRKRKISTEVNNGGAYKLRRRSDN